MVTSTKIDRLTRLILKALTLPRAEVGVFFLPNSKLRRLKRQFLKQNRTFVDVLAFPEPKGFPHPETKTRPLGEVYLNSDLTRQPRELAELLLHGILHLAGYRHQKKDDNIRMQRKTERIWAQIS